MPAVRGYRWGEGRAGCGGGWRREVRCSLQGLPLSQSQYTDTPARKYDVQLQLGGLVPSSDCWLGWMDGCLIMITILLNTIVTLSMHSMEIELKNSFVLNISDC